MKKISKKEIRSKLEGAVNQTIEELDAAPSSKKTKKLVTKASKKISVQLKSDLTKLSRKADKIAKAQAKKEKRTKKKAEQNGKQLEPVLN